MSPLLSTPRLLFQAVNALSLNKRVRHAAYTGVFNQSNTAKLPSKREMRESFFRIELKRAFCKLSDEDRNMLIVQRPHNFILTQ